VRAIGLPALPDAAAVSLPPRPVTSYGRVVARLRREIIDNAVAPASWLRMAPLAQRYGVSVQPIREALQQLQGEGLVEIFPNRGARVRGLDRRRLVHIYEIREAIETFMARRFAEEASLADIRRLEALQVRHDAAVDAADAALIQAVNGEFHGFINGHGGNREARDLVERHLDLSRTLHLLHGWQQSHWHRARREHHELIAAFHARDGALAAEIGARHVRVLRDELMAKLGRDPAETSAS